MDNAGPAAGPLPAGRGTDGGGTDGSGTDRRGTDASADRCVVSLLVALLCVLPALAQTSQRSVESLLGAGMAAFQAGKVDDAVGKLREAYKLAPKDPRVRLYLGLFLYQQSPESAEARGHMESVAEQFPSNTDLQLRLLDSYLRAEDSTKAEALVNRLEPRMLADSRFAFNVIYTLISRGQLETARKETAAISERLQGEIQFLGALIALGSKDAEQATSLLQAAAAHGFPPPDAPQAPTAADAFFQLRQFPLAAHAYEAVLAGRTDAPPLIRFRLGVAYFAFGEFNRALEQWQLVRKQAPEVPEIDFQIGATLIELKRTEEARAYLEAELKKDPKSFKAMTKMAYLEYLAGRDDDCRRWLEGSLALDGRWFETHMVFGLLYNRTGDYEKAVKSLEACIREESDYPKAHFQLSTAYRRLGNEEKARQYQESFEKLQQAAVSAVERARGMDDRPK
jgi:tetratricopeptide (TPR) repeat protein